ncbi:[protein-PII] uridylyltransferase [Streptomyces sp. DSM 42041]|uniref:Bifunctional uridylyltransferase/uridylyl-removing enzyme n=1 Tax=Streptomyces hazeniae TaxID=3075538 RepID=A0ABU2NPP2_9ACTN|nr:[protein-PII] uridylyltransferase [Streptomyces sp. DSM 42041]MDT0378739.1 [protein-PII] uridylyltransferase [Streptomyces sp. DSM 42041]
MTEYATLRDRTLHGDPAGCAGPARREALARATDEWLVTLFHGAGQPPAGTALAAAGGYGRAELSPASDLDLVLLHEPRAGGGAGAAAVASLADRVWYPVWDHGIALDHSVRTPAEAANAAAGDLKVQLGLLDLRHIAGDPRLTASVRGAALAAWRADAHRRLPELRELVRERTHRHGELRFLLEPDLKEAYGGLRDAVALRAVAASWLADAPREGLADARTALLDVRDALHLATGRTTDRLALQEQDPVAAALGLPDADALLRRVYEAAHTIGYAADVTWRDVSRVLRARAARPGRPRLLAGRRAPHGAQPERTPLADGVVAFDGEVSLARTARPDRDPVLPLRAAAAAAQAGLPLNPSAVRRLARGAAPLPVPWPPGAREEFVSLLGAGPQTVPVWEALDAVGLTDVLLPDWERVRCRPQRNPVHRWTVDRHLVETAVRASALTRRVQRPDLLLVAALLHDLGKGWPGDHSVVGETIARDAAARMGFGPDDARVLATLVRHHLLLAETATRRDPGDPATVQAVAAAVERRGTLELLHALTEADALATGPAAWSTWRASLVADLVKRVDAVLAGEAPEAAPGRLQDPRTTRLVERARRTGAPVLELFPERDTGPQDAEAATAPHGAHLLVALPDRPGGLPAVAGLLALHRLTVRTAEVRTDPDPADPGRADPGDGGTSAGPGDPAVLLLGWRVAAAYGRLPDAERLRADLHRVLDGGLRVEARLAEREAAYRTPRRGAAAPPARVTVATPEASRRATVLEVRAQDAPGLLYRIARALEQARVRVRSAHVGTLGANAVDAFYVTDVRGAPLPPAAADEVARGVQRALAERAPAEGT